jgi:pimeloyl-ACP methyl ester carboxylesterase
MAGRTTPTMSTVSSRDGTEIAWATSGEGPSLVLVHGTTADHTRWVPVLPHLEPYATVHAMDRRGRGASGDAPGPYDARREIEDVAAVVDAVAGASGTPVDVLGHSYGASCALGAARLTDHVRRLVLYEPPALPHPEVYPAGLDRRLEAAIDRGEHEAALVLFMREVVGMSEDELVPYRADASWPARVAAAPTLLRETRAEQSGVFDPRGAPPVVVPTLMLQGSESPEFLGSDTRVVAATLPDVRVVVMEGQAHVANTLVPDVFAGHVLSFLQS